MQNVPRSPRRAICLDPRPPPKHHRPGAFSSHSHSSLTAGRDLSSFPNLSDLRGNVLAMSSTTPTDAQLLAFEGKFFRHAGAKATAIRDELGVSEVAYWQRMVEILRAPAPELLTEHGPTIARLRRLLAARLVQKLPRSA